MELAREFVRNKKCVYLLVETNAEKLLLRGLEDSMESSGNQATLIAKSIEGEKDTDSLTFDLDDIERAFLKQYR